MAFSLVQSSENANGFRHNGPGSWLRNVPSALEDKFAMAENDFMMMKSVFSESFLGDFLE